MQLQRELADVQQSTERDSFAHSERARCLRGKHDGFRGDVAPEAVQLASDTANALGMPADLPLVTLLAVSELALKLQGEPPLTVAGAIMTLLAAQAAATPSKPRPKYRGRA